jgi:hypothetical protein
MKTNSRTTPSIHATRYFLACISLFILNSNLKAITATSSRVGNVFSLVETVAIPVTGNSRSTSVAWTVTDYFGRKVATGSTNLSGGVAVVHPSAGGEVGYFDLSLTEMNGSAAVATVDTRFAILPVPADRTNSPYGVQGHFAQYMPLAIAQLMFKAGIVQFRDEQYWNEIETTPGTYAYPGSYTGYMSATAALGLQSLMCLDWTNPLYDWDAGIFTGPYTANGLAGYGNYALNLVQQYASSSPIKQVEVWDEYNGGTFIAGPATANKPYYYTQMLKSVWNAIKPSHPEVQIVAGAVVPVDQGFIKSIIDQGANAYFDVVSVHPYRPVPEGVDVDLAALQDVIKAGNGGVAKPIWATEFGMDANSTADTFSTPSYLVRMVALMQASGVSRMYYYVMQDDTVTPYMGLVGQADPVSGDYLPSPAYPAYAWLINKLYNSMPQGRITANGMSPATHIYSYENSITGDYTYVCWGGAGNSPAPTTVTFTIPTATATVTDIMGNDTVLTASNGHVGVSLSLDPVYVTVAGAPASGLAETAHSVVADSMASYSRVQGTDGWYYGYASVSGAYNPASFTQLPWDYWQGGQQGWGSSYPFIQAEDMHPYADSGSDVWAVRRWKSTVAGTVTLSGTITGPGAGSAGVIAHILVNGTEVYHQAIAAGVTINYTVPNVTLSTGANVDFGMEAAAQTSNYDATAFTARVSTNTPAPTPTPPPAPAPQQSGSSPPPAPSTGGNLNGTGSSSGSADNVGSTDSIDAAGSASGAGGGAFDDWFLGFLAIAGLLRRRRRSRP